MFLPPPSALHAFYVTKKVYGPRFNVNREVILQARKGENMWGKDERDFNYIKCAT